MINGGGLYPKKPWPMLTIGCTGDAAAASLTIDLDGIRFVVQDVNSGTEKMGL